MVEIKKWLEKLEGKKWLWKHQEDGFGGFLLHSFAPVQVQIYKYGLCLPRKHVNQKRSAVFVSLK